MFASKSLLEHLARGIVGLGAFVAAALLAPLHPWLALAALPVGFVLLRGCPTCWLVGLVQTVAPRLGKANACVDGSCSKRPGSI
jgi:hypothetical protein